MASKRPPVPPPPGNDPTRSITVYCPGCGSVTENKRDKWQRPCLICFLCGFTIFCRSKGSESGFWIMQKIISANPKKYRALVQAHATAVFKSRVARGEAVGAKG